MGDERSVPITKTMDKGAVGGGSDLSSMTRKVSCLTCFYFIHNNP